MEGERNYHAYLLPGSILIAAVLISGSILYLVGNRGGQGGKAGQLAALGPTTPDNGASQPRERDVILGDPKAPVLFVEYGDYQCPFCARFFTTVEPLLRQNYIKTGKVKMVFRNFQFLGPESLAAAEAAECAKDQHQFWAYHDALYQTKAADTGGENDGILNRNLFLKLAGDLKLDTNAFANCFDSHRYANQASKDTADAQAIGVNSTPTTFVNGKMVQGALPYGQFQSIIDEDLKSS